MECYRRYAPALLRKGQRLLGNASDAEDVVQGLFVDLLERGQPAADLPYLYRAVTHRCLNLLRDRGNRQRLLQLNDQSLRGSARTRCDDLVIGLQQLDRLLDRLDARSAEVLVYHYFDDLPQEEIAELLSLSRKTIGKILGGIRDQVRALEVAGAGGES